MKSFTLVGEVFEYCLRAQPIAFLMKKSVSCILFAQYENKMSSSVFSLYFNWYRMAERLTHKFSSSIQLSISGRSSGCCVIKWPRAFVAKKSTTSHHLEYSINSFNGGSVSGVHNLR